MTDKAPGKLYLCATPIGNLEDITLRVLRILKEVDCIAAEDTRHTRKLLSHFEIHTPLTSYHSHSSEAKGEQIIARLLDGQSVALVSDAGMPGISDPGAELVKMALERNIDVIPLPGPTASLAALVVSGFPTNRFTFEGFLSSQGKSRRKQLQALRHEQRTMIFYESPHRLTDTLQDMLKELGERQCAVAREITKVHEEIRRGNISEILDYYKENRPRGEITVIVGGYSGEVPEETESWSGLSPEEHVLLLEEQGLDTKEAIKEVAKLRGIAKREIYNQVHKK